GGVWNFIKTPESTNLTLAAATVVIAVATVFTYLEIHSGSTQTDRVIAADERLAAAMENAVRQAGKALDANIDMSRTDQRAWIGVNGIGAVDPKANSPVTIEARYANTGKTVALQCVMHTTVVVNQGELDIAAFLAS